MGREESAPARHTAAPPLLSFLRSDAVTRTKKNHWNEPVVSGKAGADYSEGEHSIIDAFIFFIAATSIWRTRSEDTPSSAASS